MHFKVVVRKLHAHLTDVLRVVSVLWLYGEPGSCLSGWLMQLVFNTKKKASHNHHLSSYSLQPG